ncbi:ATP-binding protein [Yersinia enterocolitica]
MLIFIAGVHGVGKGYLCSLAEKELQVTHISASKLIKDNSQITFDSSKLTETPDKNQLILLSALEKLTHSKNDLLLDGHFTLINKTGNIEELKFDIFQKMSLDGVILITEPAKTISKRLLLRDGIEITYDLDKLIEVERENAIRITKKLKTPLIILNSPTKNDFFSALKKLGMHESACHD